MKKIAKPQSSQQIRLISHYPDPQHDEDLLETIKARLYLAGDLPVATVEQQIELLEQLSTFALGRFLLAYRGLNAYWTHQLVTYSDNNSSAAMSDIEKYIFEKLPTVLATRERFGIFCEQLQTLLKPGLTLASVPCGMMSDLFSLDYSQQPAIKLIGIDLDPLALEQASALAKSRAITAQLTLLCEDAWSLNLKNEIDILVSNGLNIYEPNNTHIETLYRSFFDALKPGGTLITSFLTPPPTLSQESPWNFAEIDTNALAFQQLLFMHIIEARWQVFRTHTQTIMQLKNAGFDDIHIINDRACIFPTVIAHKAS